MSKNNSAIAFTAGQKGDTSHSNTVNAIRPSATAAKKVENGDGLSMVSRSSSMSSEYHFEVVPPTDDEFEFDEDHAAPTNLQAPPPPFTERYVRRPDSHFHVAAVQKRNVGNTSKSSGR